jgi:hypothetical protein
LTLHPVTFIIIHLIDTLLVLLWRTLEADSALLLKNLRN